MSLFNHSSSRSHIVMNFLPSSKNSVGPSPHLSEQAQHPQWQSFLSTCALHHSSNIYQTKKICSLWIWPQHTYMSWSSSSSAYSWSPPPNKSAFRSLFTCMSAHKFESGIATSDDYTCMTRVKIARNTYDDSQLRSKHHRQRELKSERTCSLK